MPPAARTTAATAGQGPARWKARKTLRTVPSSFDSTKVISVWFTGIRSASATPWSTSWLLTCSVTGPRSTLMSLPWSEASASSTTPCAPRTAASHAALNGGLPVKDSAAACTKERSEASSGPPSTCVITPPVTASATAPRTSSFSASGAVAATNLSVSPISYLAQTERQPAGTRTHATTISTADRNFRTPRTFPRQCRTDTGRESAARVRVIARVPHEEGRHTSCDT
ncbi:hypothetical protein [Streptomyces tsukubensis]|uniref:hypothetical protein n=1 Tax=Streptomyces tsukubensis TaxID=83656 RepID=UPI001872798B|nr:hypothetical protein [Streptomyces tsukubensis]